MDNKYEELRKEAKLTYDGVALGAGFSKAFAFGLSNGTKTPNAETLRKLCEFYQVSSDFLLFGDGYMKCYIEDGKNPTDVPYWFYKKARSDREVFVSVLPYYRIRRTIVGESAIRWKTLKKVEDLSDSDMKMLDDWLRTRAEKEDR